MSENPWLERRVLNYAHQGGAREAPSSTLFALRQAMENGAHALELDVHATADGEVVVCHDPTVDRTTNATGAIAAMTLAEVQALDNAYWWAPGEVVVTGRPDADYIYRGRAPADRDFAIATLREVLDALPGVYLNLDIKQTAPAVEPYEKLLADVLAEYDRVDDVIVASFNDLATQGFSEHAPQVCTSAGTAATAEFYFAIRDGKPTPESVSRHVALQVPARYEEITLVDEAFVTRAHEAGLAVHVWTIDDADEMRRLLALDVDGIMTDRPSVLRDVLATARHVK